MGVEGIHAAPLVLGRLSPDDDLSIVTAARWESVHETLHTYCRCCLAYQAVIRTLDATSSPPTQDLHAYRGNEELRSKTSSRKVKRQDDSTKQLASLFQRTHPFSSARRVCCSGLLTSNTRMVRSELAVARRLP